MSASYFKIRLLEEVPFMAEYLANYFPDKQSARTGLFELLINAIEHGNLGIGYAEKGRLLAAGNWADEVSARTKHPHYRQRTIRIHLSEHKTHNVISITDDGHGFNWQEYLGSAPMLNHSHGRGLFLAQHSGFHALAFNKRGNQVKCMCMHNQCLIRD